MVRRAWLLLAASAALCAGASAGEPGPAPRGSVLVTCVWTGPESMACALRPEEVPERLRPCVFEVAITPDGQSLVEVGAPKPPAASGPPTCDARRS